MFVKGEQIMYSVFEQLLQDKGVSRYRVSKDTGIPQTTLSTWKTRGTDPGVPIMKKLADYFGVSIEYLATGKDNSHAQITPQNWNEERQIGFLKDMTDEEIIEASLAAMKYTKDHNSIETISHVTNDEAMLKRLLYYYKFFTDKQRSFIDSVIDHEIERGAENDHPQKTS